MFRKVNLTSYTIRGKVWKIKIAARMKMEKKARKGRKWSYLTMVPATNSNKRLRFTSKEISKNQLNCETYLLKPLERIVIPLSM